MMALKLPKRGSLSTGLLALLCSLAPGSATAQELLLPAARQGYYLAGGVHTGVVGTRDEDLGGLVTAPGSAFTFRLGQMANQWLGFGLSISGGGTASDVWTSGYAALSLEVQYVPIPYDNLAIRGGVGLAALFVGRKDPAQAREDDPSGALSSIYTLGVSYDLFPLYEPKSYESGGFSIAGFAQGHLMPGDGLLTGGFLIGLEVSYWFGLNKNKLELPTDAAFQKK